MGQARLDGLSQMYIHNDISISTGGITKKFAATSRKIKTLISCSVLCCNYCKQFLTLFVKLF